MKAIWALGWQGRADQDVQGQHGSRHRGGTPLKNVPFLGGR
jgi:hypothetical protein